MEEKQTYDVLVVGLGPVGSTAAILLAEQGLSVAAVERDEEVYRLPRAVVLDAEIVRAFQRVGRAEAVAELLQPVRPGERAGFTNSRREWHFSDPTKAFGPNGWQPMNFFDQPELEGYLRGEAQAHPNVTALVGYEAHGLEQDEAEVSIVATPHAEGEDRRLHGKYLLACDGASSSIRRGLDIEWESLGYDHDWLVVDVTALDGNTLGLDTLQVCDPDRLVTYVCTKDPYRRWEFRMNEGETPEQMLKESTIQALIDPWTPRGTYQIRRAAVYQFHAATAERWRQGRVFIAGDAAHQTPPFLGQGMNAGMRDVVNLAWKFPLVIQERVGEELLESYQAERDAHARDLVDWAVSAGRLMEHLADIEQAERDGGPPPATPKALMQSGYGQGRTVPPLRDGVIMIDQQPDSSWTGAILSQPIVRDGSGDECRLDDLLGPGFALVVRSPDEVELNERSQTIINTLNIETVVLDDLQAVRGNFDRLFQNHTAALVRPDRVVFGHTGDTTTADDLLHALAQQLNLVLAESGSFP